jgi:hypothetical protein
VKMNPLIRVFGDLKFRGPCPYESNEQVTFFNVLRRDYPELGAIAIHPRNEGNKTHQQVMREKSEGMTPGASDIIIPGAPCFVCELKRQNHAKCHWEPKQQEYLLAAQSQGAFVCVALGYKAALEAVKEWLKLVNK